MIPETSVAETKPRSCCSGKKKAPEDPVIPPNKEITPIVEIEKPLKQEQSGCQCCSNNAEPDTDGTHTFKMI